MKLNVTYRLLKVNRTIVLEYNNKFDSTDKQNRVGECSNRTRMVSTWYCV